MAFSRILIVEDESIIALDLERSLGALGYEVVGTVADADSALAIVALGTTDMVLMDIHLAGDVDGIDAARLIRGRYGVPTVFLTAFSEDTVRHRASFADPMGYLQKPFETADLRKGLAAAFTRWRGA